MVIKIFNEQEDAVKTNHLFRKKKVVMTYAGFSISERRQTAVNPERKIIQRRRDGETKR